MAKAAVSTGDAGLDAGGDASSAGGATSSDGGGGGGAGGSGGTTASAGGATADAASPAVETIEFAGITAASPANATPPGAAKSPDSILVSWLPASYPQRPLAAIRYEIFWSDTPNKNFTAPQETAPPGSTSFTVQDLPPSKKPYYFVVRAVADEGTAKDTNTVELSATLAFDDKAPTFAGVSSVKAAGPQTVTLSWKAATDDLTKAPGIVYRAYWALNATSAFQLGAVSAPGATSVDLSGLPTPETEYLFKVYAVDAAGNVDGNTAAKTGTTGKDVKPPVFTGCDFATNPSANGALVGWQPAIDDTTGAADITYNVYASDVPVTRDTKFSDLILAGTFKGVTSGRIAHLNADTRYRLICRAMDAKGNEDSNRITQVIATKHDGTPPTFAGATGMVPMATAIDLTWAAATDGETASDSIVYNVYSSFTAGGEDFTAPPLYTITGGVTRVTLNKDPTLAKATDHVSNTHWYFVVRASDDAQNMDTNTVEVDGTTRVSFDDDVQVIFSGNCAVKTCHTRGLDGTNPPINGQNLDVGAAYDSIVGVPAQEYPSSKRIDPTPDGAGVITPANSYMYRKIANIQPYTGQRMPAGGQLSQVQIDTIGLWITQGALRQ